LVGVLATAAAAVLHIIGTGAWLSFVLAGALALAVVVVVVPIWGVRASTASCACACACATPKIGAQSKANTTLSAVCRRL